MTSLVFLIANNPAALENSNTFPFGTWLFFIASMVSCFDVLTIAVAMALRKLLVLFVMSFILIQLFCFHWYDASSKISLPHTGSSFLILSTTSSQASIAAFRCAEDVNTNKEISPDLTIPKL